MASFSHTLFPCSALPRTHHVVGWERSADESVIPAFICIHLLCMHAMEAERNEGEEEEEGVWMMAVIVTKDEEK